MKKTKRVKRIRGRRTPGINIKISNRLSGITQSLKSRTRLIPRKATVSVPGYTPMTPFPNPGSNLVLGTADSFSGLQSGTQLARDTAKVIDLVNQNIDDAGDTVPVFKLKNSVKGSLSGNFHTPRKSQRSSDPAYQSPSIPSFLKSQSQFAYRKIKRSNSAPRSMPSLERKVERKLFPTSPSLPPSPSQAGAMTDKEILNTFYN